MLTYIDGDYNNTKHCNPDRHVQVGSPVLNDKPSSGEIRGGCDDVFEKIVPAGRKTVFGISTLVSASGNNLKFQVPVQLTLELDQPFEWHIHQIPCSLEEKPPFRQGPSSLKRPQSQW